MGRYRRRNHNKKHKDSFNQTSKRFFTPHELIQLEGYLISYKSGTKSKTPTEITDVSLLLRIDHGEDSYTIGSHRLPLLNSKTLSMPFLLLPSTLSKEQRRSIHDLCGNLSIFHGSISLHDAASVNQVKEEERFCVISTYALGFELLYKQNLLNHPVRTPIRKPWFYQQKEEKSPSCSNSVLWQQDSQVSRINSEMKDVINKLMIYSSDCVRECDIFDMKALIGRDLSMVEPAGENFPFLFVDTVEKLKQCAQEISESKSSELAFDLEMYNRSKYFGMTCLLQLAVPNKDYVIDVIAPGIWGSLKDCLGPFFLNPAIVKIGHGIGGMDIPALHRDFGLFVVNAFDTCMYHVFC